MPAPWALLPATSCALTVTASVASEPGACAKRDTAKEKTVAPPLRKTTAPGYEQSAVAGQVSKLSVADCAPLPAPSSTVARTSSVPLVRGTQPLTASAAAGTETATVGEAES